MSKKGFTLVELLAVIVILAVISLITIPLIMGVIEESKVGAFKDSVMLSFSSAELYEARVEVITTAGINVVDLDMKNNNFKYGKIIKNASGDLEAVNVSDGNYCANGVLTNITVYDGECDSSIPSYPSVAVNNTDYEISKTYILTPPSVISGIARYEYYLSESNTNPGSDVTVSGTSLSNEITINVNATYIFFRVVSVAGLNGLWTNNKTNYVDNTNPTVSLTSSVVTSNSVTLVGLASDENSGITKYEFSKDGTNYIDNGTNNTYTFSNLSTGSNTYYLRVTNGSGLTSTTSLIVETVLIDTPTYSISPSGYATTKTLTITYPSGYTNEYSLDSGTTWITYTAPIVFNANGSVIARVNDGTNYVTGSSYTITNIDTTNPTVSVSVSGKVGTITLGDNLLLSGYTVTTSATVPTVWTEINGTSSSQSYTGTVAGTYYAWVKDAAGNTSYSNFVLATNAFCAYTAGNLWNFAYNGGIQTFTVPCSGTYKVEVWGAQGGSNSYTQGGLGGYAVGNRILSKDNIVYIVVGSQGDMVTSQTQTGTGGYNGGGTAAYRNSNNYRCSGGGGATHIALTTGVLSSIGYTSGVTNGNLLIAAGGGGGGYYDGGNSTGQNGYAGGGTNGSGGYGGTQTSNTYSSGANAGGFGFGSASTFSSGAGGGGLYGGGSAYYVSGSGGSGYLSSSLTSSSMTSGVKTGNGYATITFVSSN